MYVTTDTAQAKKWAELSLANASANSFYPVDDDEAENLFNAIGAEDYACTWVYKMNVAYRWFLGYLMNEQIPHFSTVSYMCKHVSF